MQSMLNLLTTRARVVVTISWIAKDQEWRVPLFSQNIESLVPFDAYQWADEQAAGTQNYFGFFRRAVHVQSFQSPCTCTAQRVLPSDFTPFDRANQELQGAFLDESLAQKFPTSRALREKQISSGKTDYIWSLLIEIRVCSDLLYN